MSNYTMSPVVNGEKKQMIVKVGDTLPIGGIMDYEGSVVPNGWQQVENVLWENTSPTTAIENGAEFSLSSSDYDYYSIIYNLSTSGTNISFNTEKIPKGQETVLSIITSGASNFRGLQRNINYTSDTKLTSGVPYSFNNSSRSVDNTALIPTKIIGYKKQIKKIAPVTPANGNIKNSYGTSQTDTYSQEYINKFTDYSTEEQVIGKWIDGKPIYRITYSMGGLPASTSTSKQKVVTSLNIDTITNLYGIAWNNTKTTTPLPSSGVAGGNIGCDLYCWSNGSVNVLTIFAHGDLSAYTTSYVTMEYTKTTD